MPTLRPMIPWTAISVASSYLSLPPEPPRAKRSLGGGLFCVLLAESLDLHVHPRGQVQLHEGVHRLGSGLEDVQEPLVGSYLELFPALLVHVGRAQRRPAVLDRRQG